MRTGMLWFDDARHTTLEEKILRAREHYIQKYGHTPNTCYLHPSALLDGLPEIEGMTILESSNVLPSHLWMGINNLQGENDERPQDLS